MQHSQTKPGRRGCTKSSTMASPDVGSKKRSILRNLLSQPAHHPPTREISMRPSSRRRVLGVTASLVIAALSPAIAQEQSHAAKGPETSVISRVLTGKERLGRKWMDEQRIDNCKVPIDKRGTKPRLDTC